MVEGSQKPKFSTRLKYPVTFPLLNDKIVMKTWHNGGYLPDIFIANIPENPFVDGWFNINYLQSTGGNLPFTWVAVSNSRSACTESRPPSEGNGTKSCSAITLGF